MRSLARQVCVRLTSELHELLKQVTEARGEDVSSFIRRALLKELAELSFVSEQERKALGLTQKDQAYPAVHCQGGRRLKEDQKKR